MKKLFIAVAAIALLGFSAPSYAQRQYPTAQQAQRHCPNDIVVWLNIPTRIYHMPGTRWYGMTKYGAFVCEAAADRAGDRPAANGQ
jgi:hypothetical protein